jgi:hypothetical protein
VDSDFPIIALALLAWALPFAFAIWFIMSVNDIKQLLRDIRDALHDGRE